MPRPTTAIINLNFLKQNTKTLKALLGNKGFFCPMIKANGYGHGDVEVAKALSKEKISAFGVVLVEEGIKLREAGIQEKILVFGFFDKKSMQACMQNNLTPVISSFDFLKLLPKGKKTGIHLKFDTGMARLGFQAHEVQKLIDELDLNKNIIVEGICTHFISGEDVLEKNSLTTEQMKKYSEIEKKLSGRYQISHCQNSATICAQFKGVEAYHNGKNFLGARPGLAIYGYSSLEDEKSKTLNLKPVMTVKSAIVQLRNIKKGESVSYGATWKSTKDSLIATVCIGYADGYLRILSNQSDMLFRGRKAPLVGRVCMDYCMIDLTNFKNEVHPQVGEEVVVWGYQGKEFLGLDSLAEKSNTISYEFMTRLSSRVKRVYTA